MSKYSTLEESISYKFKNISNLDQALTHSSYANEHLCKSNETLEFIGDSVLDLCMAKYFISDDKFNEGQMTKKRATYVCEEALALYADKLDLKSYMKLGIGEAASGGRNRGSLLADAFEALLGAIFLDSGFDECYLVTEKIVFPYLSNVDVTDYKSKLQELLATDRRTIQYKLVSEDGPPHNKTYEFSALLEGNIVMGVGVGKTKLKAEQNAAKEALTKIAK